MPRKEVRSFKRRVHEPDRKVGGRREQPEHHSEWSAICSLTPDQARLFAHLRQFLLGIASPRNGCALRRPSSRVTNA